MVNQEPRTPWNPRIGCADLTPSIGVTSTPVIDTATNIAYLTHKTYVSGTTGPARWYMDAIDVAGRARSLASRWTERRRPKRARADIRPTTEMQRPGLLLMEGVVYAAFGSRLRPPALAGLGFRRLHGRGGQGPLGRQRTGTGAGIWQSGAGLTSDGAGTLLLSTGNGGAPAAPTPGSTPPANLGESVVRLRVQADGSLKPTDFFAPFDAASLDTWDADFASGGVTGLPERILRHRRAYRTWRWRWASRATCTCSTATTSAASARGRRARTTWSSASAPMAACGRAPASGLAKAAGSTSRQPRAATARRGSAGQPARVQLRPLGHRRAHALAAGDLLRRVRLLLERAGHHLRRHHLGLGARVDRVDGQRQGRRARSCAPTIRCRSKASPCCARARPWAPPPSSRHPASARDASMWARATGTCWASARP